MISISSKRHSMARQTQMRNIELISLINFKTPKRASRSCTMWDRTSLACEIKATTHTRTWVRINWNWPEIYINCHGMPYVSYSQMRMKKESNLLPYGALSLSIRSSTRINVKWRITKWLLLPRFHLRLTPTRGWIWCSQHLADSNSPYNKRRVMRCD